MADETIQELKSEPPTLTANICSLLEWKIV